MTDARCWILTDGTPGMENQCRGLAEHLGFEPVVKRARLRPPWSWAPPRLAVRPLAGLAPSSDGITPPWPRLLIASGRASVALSIAIRRRAGGATFTVQIQNPTVPVDRFDLVVTPRHDGLRGANVLATRGALNRVRPDLLAREAARFGDRVADLPRPLIAVLVGGASRAARFTPDRVEALVQGLRAVSAGSRAGLAVTPSRRTGRALAAALTRGLADRPAVIWDGAGANPYLGWLGLADGFVVTSDSVNMVSEAATTGKPVQVFDVTRGSAKFERFHAALRADGVTRPFQGRLERWTYAPLDDTARVAAAVRQRARI